MCQGAIPTSIPLCPPTTMSKLHLPSLRYSTSPYYRPLEFSSCYVRIMISAHTGTTVDAYPVLEVYYTVLEPFAPLTYSLAADLRCTYVVSLPLNRPIEPFLINHIDILFICRICCTHTSWWVDYGDSVGRDLMGRVGDQTWMSYLLEDTPRTASDSSSRNTCIRYNTPPFGLNLGAS